MTTRSSAQANDATTLAQASRGVDLKRSLVLVAGSGRSGTSLFSGILQRLGFYVPQPEVPADSTNPRGFAESQWVVNFHTRLLNEAGVQVADARPAAWAQTAEVALDESIHDELSSWLGKQFEESDHVIVKDPRLSSVPTALAPLCRVGRRRAAFRDRPSSSRRGGGLEAAVVRSVAGRRGQDGGMAEPDPLHGAGDTGGPACLCGLRRPTWMNSDRIWWGRLGEAARSFESSAVRRGVDRLDPRVRRPLAQPLSGSLGGLRHPIDAARAVGRRLEARLPSLPGRRTTDSEAITAELETARAAYASLYEDSEAIAQSSVIPRTTRQG